MRSVEETRPCPGLSVPVVTVLDERGDVVELRLERERGPRAVAQPDPDAIVPHDAQPPGQPLEEAHVGGLLRVALEVAHPPRRQPS